MARGMRKASEGPWSATPHRGDTRSVQRIATFFAAALRGPAGGMLACLLLAGMLGGIAMAGPSALRGAEAPPTHDRGGASHDEDGLAGRGDDDHDDPTGPSSSHGVEECRATVRHLQGDLASGNHGGLTHAIEVVGENCRRNTQAPGLLRALDRLAANHERWVERHGDGNRSAGDPPGQDGDPPGQDKEKPEHQQGDHAPQSSGGSGPP
jgi:hypothetical protein